MQKRYSILRGTLVFTLATSISHAENIVEASAMQIFDNGEGNPDIDNFLGHY
ncbi:hypothetical protein [Agaribacter marinus]|uniref:Uncharacterized protein n=1 Tax=Agaribacter marinus TaxID=1431249 RepID=A0AA37SZ61_9ALTE|nr:hypothetical protein [Agaribacter marinus]GLR71019.1 hypothetical protein GCM10007852_19270 [Agaribacter marinus]